MTLKTIRFVNFLLDTAIYLTFMVVFFMCLSDVIEKDHVKWISILTYFLYYFLSEYFTGQTIGKIVTKSKVIKVN